MRHQQFPSHSVGKIFFPLIDGSDFGNEAFFLQVGFLGTTFRSIYEEYSFVSEFCSSHPSKTNSQVVLHFVKVTGSALQSWESKMCVGVYLDIS